MDGTRKGRKLILARERQRQGPRRDILGCVGGKRVNAGRLRVSGKRRGVVRGRIWRGKKKVGEGKKDGG